MEQLHVADAEFQVVLGNRTQCLHLPPSPHTLEFSPLMHLIQICLDGGCSLVQWPHPPISMNS